MITYTARPYYGETEIMHSWTLTVDGEDVSELWANLKTGQIMQVETKKAHQGEGHATALYRHATQTVDLYHSPQEHRTPAGDAFAHAVGGETIDPELAYQPN